MTSSTTSEVDGVVDAAVGQKIIESLRGRFAGQVIEPGNPEYEQARTVWNAMVDKRPGLILTCTSTANVVTAVNVSREFGLAPSVRCGGHNVAGKALSDGGLTIDLAGLRDVTVDAERHLAHAGGGCRLGDLDAATGPLGLIVPAGIMSDPELFWALRGGADEDKQDRVIEAYGERKYARLG